MQNEFTVYAVVLSFGSALPLLPFKRRFQRSLALSMKDCGVL